MLLPRPRKLFSLYSFLLGKSLLKWPFSSERNHLYSGSGFVSLFPALTVFCKVFFLSAYKALALELAFLLFLRTEFSWMPVFATVCIYTLVLMSLCPQGHIIWCYCLLSLSLRRSKQLFNLSRTFSIVSLFASPSDNISLFSILSSTMS